MLRIRRKTRRILSMSPQYMDRFIQRSVHERQAIHSTAVINIDRAAERRARRCDADTMMVAVGLGVPPVLSLRHERSEDPSFWQPTFLGPEA